VWQHPQPLHFPEIMRHMMNKTPLVLMIGVAALALLGCSKQPAPAPAAPAAVADDEMESQAQAPAAQKPKETVAEKATKMLGYIQDKPECQQFRAALEQARDAGDETVSVEKIMGDAYKAGCSK
jgi:hypothetical protein